MLYFHLQCNVKFNSQNFFSDPHEYINSKSMWQWLSIKALHSFIIRSEFVIFCFHSFQRKHVLFFILKCSLAADIHRWPEERVSVSAVIQGSRAEVFSAGCLCWMLYTCVLLESVTSIFRPSPVSLSHVLKQKDIVGVVWCSLQSNWNVLLGHIE